MNYKDIFVLCEFQHHKLVEASCELVSEATRLVAKRPDLNYDIVGVVIGDEPQNQVNEIFHYGADRVIKIHNNHLKEYDSVLYTELIKQLIDQKLPDVFLFPATVLGRDLAPRIASACTTGLTADATKLDLTEDTNSSLLMVTRPAFGGNLFATIVCERTKPQMATIRPGVMVLNERKAQINPQVENLTLEVPGYEARTRILETIHKELKHADITKASILISGGRGIGDNFHVLREAADKIGAEVSGSRSAVDAGFIDKELQVGQTGKSVKPKIYIACGISGAVQHLAGMEKSDFVIAINTDESAPIFQVANLGIVGDALEIIPMVTEEIARKKASHFQS
ncbi:electron transfer flavoprotein subunit alpha/FixB family protein [Proteiniclasticum sp. QWL-01]|uniref:electron transfer flavoprotein subunit alpha/FixB family protein n=1 Tax=Proteiniclasticum sp. QWL-01 TaxID=3036945 RepID=UPI002207C1C8|nr:electron transfer flavoprotein subunit alpha/FixB family protein [Proteiniclasticum sp. QWL-01]UUM12190.1 electron transfer flavoprotein subunit alpha/FixB family protein [Clostridiaceae bacterium HFYG-1003]WFF73721.1 electron transfer flavoprotein subunit alpha/FixB family protein [Proteiniclasticum sp. QWL-01]